MLLNTEWPTAAIKPSNYVIFHQLYHELSCRVAFPINGYILAHLTPKVSHGNSSLSIYSMQFSMSMLSWDWLLQISSQLTIARTYYKVSKDFHWLTSFWIWRNTCLQVEADISAETLHQQKKVSVPELGWLFFGKQGWEVLFWEAKLKPSSGVPSW